MDNTSHYSEPRLDPGPREMYRTSLIAPKEIENEQRSNNNLTADQQRIKVYRQTVGRSVAMTHQRYVDPKFLQKNQISLIPISFTTGNLPVGVKQYLEPIPPSTIEQWIARARPWTITTDFAMPDVKNDPFNNNGQIEAAAFWGIIKTYLTDAAEDSNVLPIIYQTYWRPQGNNLKTLNRLHKGYANWQVQVFLSYSLGPSQGDKEDQKTSQIICFLADEAPLREKTISTSELTTIIVLATNTAMVPCYQFLHIPITVVSGSGRHVRIVQGVFNTQHCTLDLRMSDTISFEKGIVANKQNFFTLLGWLLAKPVGKTALPPR